MGVRPRVLLVGDEVRVLQTRQMVLGTRFEVRTSARLSEAFGLVLGQKYDLIVVFPPTESWDEFADFMARRDCKPMIIAITLNGDEPPSWAEMVIPINKGPFELLKVCAEKFDMTLKSKSLGFSDRSWKKVISFSSPDE